MDRKALPAGNGIGGACSQLLDGCDRLSLNVDLRRQRRKQDMPRRVHG
jgi:hypothetical protein